MTDMKETIAALLEQYPLQSNPYFAALQEGSFDREDFLETQVQFYYAVVFFSRPMAVLAAKIPSAATRTEILRNVWEEHGEGQAGSRHGATFLELLKRIDDIRQEDVEARALWPELRAFNTNLIGCCALDDWEIGAGCLGIIERMFVDISAFLGEQLDKRGWLAADRVVHYSVHKELDVRHSEDFFATLQPTWERGPRERYLITQGLQLGAYVFDRLYRDLYEARTRRSMSAVDHPQRHIYNE